jgi:hypothetical protein
MKYLILCLCLFLAPVAAAQDGVGGIDKAYRVTVTPMSDGTSIVIGVRLCWEDVDVPQIAIWRTDELGPLMPCGAQTALFLILHTASGWVVVPVAPAGPPKTIFDHSVVTVPMHAEEMQ